MEKLIGNIKGPKGEDGAKGDQGIQGAKGDTGEQGIQGIPGAKGDAGAQGAKGDPGADGKSVVGFRLDTNGDLYVEIED